MDRKTAAVVVFGIVCVLAGFLASRSGPPASWYTGFKQPEWWLTVAAFVTLWVIWRQTDVAEHAAKTALQNTNAFIHSQRPWLSPSVSVAGPVKYDEQGAHVTLDITVENVGQVPAIGIWIDPQCYVTSPIKPPAIEERKRICKEIVQRKPDLGNVAFPGRPVLQRYTISASASEIEACNRAIFGNAGAVNRLYGMNIIVAVAYRAGFDLNAPYYTALIYDLYRNDPSRTTYTLLPIGESVPKELLLLFLSPVGGIVAE